MLESTTCVPHPPALPSPPPRHPLQRRQAAADPHLFLPGKRTPAHLYGVAVRLVGAAVQSQRRGCRPPLKRALLLPRFLLQDTQRHRLTSSHLLQLSVGHPFTSSLAPPPVPAAGHAAPPPGRQLPAAAGERAALPPPQQPPRRLHELHAALRGGGWIGSNRSCCDGTMEHTFAERR